MQLTEQSSFVLSATVSEIDWKPKYCHALRLVETTGGHGPVTDIAC